MSTSPSKGGRLRFLISRRRRLIYAILAVLAFPAFLTATLAAPASATATTTLADAQTGMCLETDYFAVYTIPCDGSNLENWSLSQSSAVISGNGTAPPTVTITNAQTGMCLGSNSSNPAYPATGLLYTASCDGSHSQVWALSISPTTGTVTFTDATTGMCLDSNYSDPILPSTGATYTLGCNGGSYQNWKVQIPPGFSRIPGSTPNSPATTWYAPTWP
jgi:hypothetical protein